MTSLTKRVRDWLHRPGPVCECRQCGTSLDDDQDTCPECGSTDVVCYEVE